MAGVEFAQASSPSVYLMLVSPLMALQVTNHLDYFRRYLQYECNERGNTFCWSDQDTASLYVSLVTHDARC